MLKSCNPRLAYFFLIVTVIAMCMAAAAAPAPNEKERENKHEGTEIDSGSFGVFQNNHRVGTEKFTIYQTSYGSLTHSEFKTENASTEAAQASELQLTSNGEIRRYEWKEISPGKAQSMVVPNSDFLTQKWKATPQEKEQEQPYLLPVSTSILDDYFFVQRELLAWKFLGQSCKQDKGQLECPLKQRSQFGTLNPHQHSPAPLSMEFLGREKISTKTGQQDLLKLELKTDASTWQLWLNDQFKVMRMVVVGENTQVDRD
jgi:hypothetical protein